MNDFKTCTNCNEKLPSTKEFFHAQKKGLHGFRSVCIDCNRVIAKKYRSTDEYKEKARVSHAKWREDNRDKHLEISRRSWANNGIKYNAIRKDKYNTDEDFKQKKKNAEKRYKESGARYLANSKPEQMEKARIRSKKRRLIDEKKDHDYARNAKWREKYREHLNLNSAIKRNELHKSYVAQCMRLKTEDLNENIYQTKKLIIQLKREFKNI